MILEEQRASATNHEKVLASLVIEVGKQGACRVVEHADSGFLRNVFEGSVAAVAIKPVGQSCRLGDIEIVETVVVKVACRHAVVAVDIDADGAV